MERRPMTLPTERSVLQPWVSSLTLMQQSVLLTAIRGCDGLPKYHVSKYLLRWYRRSIMLTAFLGKVMPDPFEPCGGNFTGPVQPEAFATLNKDYLGSVDEIPHHFHMHIIHAAEVVGYKHPTVFNREWWLGFYLAAVQDLHLHPETENEMDYRLGDVRENWLAVGREELR